MKLIINRQQTSIKDKRKLKLLHIDQLSKRSRKKINFPIGFDWKLTYENEEEYKEGLKNFHLFCISITEDLVENNFKTNEDGAKTYLKCADKNLIRKLNKLTDIVSKSK